MLVYVININKLYLLLDNSWHELILNSAVIPAPMTRDELNSGQDIKKYLNPKLGKEVLDEKVDKTNILHLNGEVLGSSNLKDLSITTQIVGDKKGTVLYSKDNKRTEYDYVFKEAYICETIGEVNFAKNSLVPDFATIFNSWPKFSMQGSAQPGNPEELTAWTYDSNTDIFKNTTNSASAVGAVSIEKYDNCRLEATLKSTNTDDDYIGLVLAFTIDENGYENALTAWRSPGGLKPIWTIYHNYLVSGREYHTLTNQQRIYDGSAKVKYGNGQYNGATAGWSTLPSGVRIKALREKNIITVQTTDFYDFGNTNFVDTVIIDLTSSNILQKYNKKCSIGFCARSQLNSMWTDAIIGEEFEKIIYDLSTDPSTYHKYNSSIQSWETFQLGDLGIERMLGFGRLYLNTTTKKAYITFPDGIKKLSLI
jgi:hypothetical protein